MEKQSCGGAACGGCCRNEYGAGVCKGEGPRGGTSFSGGWQFYHYAAGRRQDTNRTKPDTVELIEASLDEVKPDLVILMGDNIAGSWFGARIHAQEKAEKAIGNIVGPIAQRRIPFAGFLATRPGFSR